jgi:hypothetical protein
MESRTCSELPPGFRFHPTDEELIVYYLCNQATSQPCPASIIPEVDIYKFDPWELPGIIIYIYIYIYLSSLIALKNYIHAVSCHQMHV